MMSGLSSASDLLAHLQRQAVSTHHKADLRKYNEMTALNDSMEKRKLARQISGVPTTPLTYSSAGDAEESAAKVSSVLESLLQQSSNSNTPNANSLANTPNNGANSNAPFSATATATDTSTSSADESLKQLLVTFSALDESLANLRPHNAPNPVVDAHLSSTLELVQPAHALLPLGANAASHLSVSSGSSSSFSSSSSSSSASSLPSPLVHAMSSANSSGADGHSIGVPTFQLGDLSNTLSDSNGISAVVCQGNGSAEGFYTGTSCHQCKTRRFMNDLFLCKNSAKPPKRAADSSKKKKPCRRKYCTRCVVTFYGEFPNQPCAAIGDWLCPSCRNKCSCSSCKKVLAKKARQHQAATVGGATTTLAQNGSTHAQSDEQNNDDAATEEDASQPSNSNSSPSADQQSKRRKIVRSENGDEVVDTDKTGSAAEISEESATAAGEGEAEEEEVMEEESEEFARLSEKTSELLAQVAAIHRWNK